MSTTVTLLKSLVRPHKRGKYVRRLLLHEESCVDPRVFLELARRFGIVSVTRPYLNRYTVRLDVNGGSVTEAVLSIGSFQHDVFLAFVQYLPDLSLPFVNVGANIGTTCLNAHAAGFRTIYGFEPVGDNFLLLEENLEQVRNDVDIFLEQIALGATNGAHHIYMNSRSTGRHSLVRDFGFGSEEILVRKLDDVAPPRSSVLWVDAEGYEAEILRGATGYVHQYCEAMCLEITPSLLGRDGLIEIDGIARRRFSRVTTTEGVVKSSLLELDAVRDGDQVDVFFLR